jgi:hypothetical protein
MTVSLYILKAIGGSMTARNNLQDSEIQKFTWWEVAMTYVIFRIHPTRLKLV